MEGCCWNGSEKHHQAIQSDHLILSLLFKTQLIVSKFTGDEEEGCRAHHYCDNPPLVPRYPNRNRNFL